MNNQKLKSVHITNYYHKNSGGISTSYNNLLAAAERRERFVRLIVPGEKEEIEEVNFFAKIYYVPAKQSPVFDKRYRVMMPWDYMPDGSPIRKILLAEMPDMIEVTDKYSLSMIGAMIRLGKFKQINRPMLVHFSCERMDDNIASFLTKNSWGKWLARRLMGNYNFPSFDFHIANSAYTAEEFYQAVEKQHNPNRSDKFFDWCWRKLNAGRIPYQEKIYVCPRGVNADIFKADRKSDAVKRELRELANIPQNAVVMLYAGRISPEKNVELLIGMMKILAQDTAADFRLLIAGAGPQKEFMQSETAKNFPDKIVFLGHLEKEKLADFYANCDIFVHPNPREPFGIAPLEAMASGAPTLAPNSGGILSYATQENAWLVAPSAENFAAAAREIVETPALTKQKIQNAIATALNNTRENSTDNLFATYDKMYQLFQSEKELFVTPHSLK